MYTTIAMHTNTHTHYFMWTKGWFNYFISSLAVGPSHHRDIFFSSSYAHINIRSFWHQNQQKKRLRKKSKLGDFISDFKPLTSTHVPYNTIQYNIYRERDVYLFIYWFTDFLNVALFCGRRACGCRRRSLQLFAHLFLLMIWQMCFLSTQFRMYFWRFLLLELVYGRKMVTSIMLLFSIVDEHSHL